MLNVKNLSFCYKNLEVENKILDNISFNLEDGKVYALLGINGAGKTTLIKCIMRIFKNYYGDVFIDDFNTKKLTSLQLSKLISYIPQQREIAFSYSVKDTIEMGLSNNLKFFESPNESNDYKINEVLNILGIEHIKYKSYNNISGGEKQLVLIARALIQNAKIILMDEPTSALDFNNQLKVMEVINKLKLEGYTILISCHSPYLVLNYTDEIIALKNKTIVEKGITKNKLNENLIMDLYNVKTKIIRDENGIAIIPIIK